MSRPHGSRSAGWAAFLHYGALTGPIIGVLWLFVVATTAAVAASFLSGGAFRPSGLASLILGVALGLAALRLTRWPLVGVSVVVMAVTMLVGIGPVATGQAPGWAFWVAVFATGIGTGLGLAKMLHGLPLARLTRHEFEDAVIRFLTGFGYLFFTFIVAVPFYVMLMTSLKNQQQLVQNPLDFSLDLSQGWHLFDSYVELMTTFNFGSYLWTSFYVSLLTVLLTLIFSIPGAYAVARLRFRGAAMFSRSILLIYMVPMIVLALPIYIAYSMIGLRNSVFGLVLIYPVTTIPVALYMLQGYFRGLPAEIEEAGLMDGLSRLRVIWKITLPLSLPALASVSLYVFMIAWNEFLLAFMLLDDPSKFTLTRGVAMLNSSEIPRQHLMAGSVIATVPIMVLFLGLERFMTKGLTAGSVKG
ncbi:carbohydrate ABC transporter membrane protein 2, CUT1 family [Tranquillimonas rosea]|uniref:Carbohydrate ABC transporter membrane protein 2, CUT1 family n=1 Tax=Tranquillimonas rosea TaxID=641238 RepID=A0A1H9W2I2_9RHOB|nr:carbohydrate ABC transporter permease [Tranquillimonas rosea]SES28115.1 carbohydrate ABC transporter membrane protein 2, CUT1 family [Tranquillimonas rosea]